MDYSQDSGKEYICSSFLPLSLCTTHKSILYYIPRCTSEIFCEGQIAYQTECLSTAW